MPGPSLIIRRGLKRFSLAPCFDTLDEYRETRWRLGSFHGICLGHLEEQVGHSPGRAFRRPTTIAYKKCRNSSSESGAAEECHEARKRAGRETRIEAVAGTINKLSTHRRTRLQRTTVAVFLPGMENAVVVSHCRLPGQMEREKSVDTDGAGTDASYRVMKYEFRGWRVDSTSYDHIVVSLIPRFGTLFLPYK